MHGRYTVMVAEDNEVNMVLASAILSVCLPDAEIIKALDGNEAVLKFKSSRPDLVFMDIQMPGLSGYEAARAIRETEDGTAGRVPLIALTAGTVQGERERCLDAGMDDYITKPVVAGTIRDVLQRWLPECECAYGSSDAGSKSTGNNDSVNSGAPERFNREQLLANIEGDLGIFNMLTSIAMTTFTRGLEDIKAAYSQKDMQEVKKRAHKVRGSALNIGCNILAEMAARLEMLVEYDEAGVRALLQEMGDEIALIGQDIETGHQEGYHSHA
jgi:CheY-like chemotaxis protein/HPt (histidine-containing phosphotransfer) domain-containing protein